jgi:hypothetical protein
MQEDSPVPLWRGNIPERDRYSFGHQIEQSKTAREAGSLWTPASNHSVDGGCRCGVRFLINVLRLSTFRKGRADRKNGSVMLLDGAEWIAQHGLWQYLTQQRQLYSWRICAPSRQVPPNLSRIVSALFMTYERAQMGQGPNVK